MLLLIIIASALELLGCWMMVYGFVNEGSVVWTISGFVLMVIAILLLIAAFRPVVL